MLHCGAFPQAAAFSFLPKADFYRKIGTGVRCAVNKNRTDLYVVENYWPDSDHCRQRWLSRNLDSLNQNIASQGVVLRIDRPA